MKNPPDIISKSTKTYSLTFSFCFLHFHGNKLRQDTLQVQNFGLLLSMEVINRLYLVCKKPSRA